MNGDLSRSDEGLIDEWELVVVTAEKDRNDVFSRPRAFHGRPPQRGRVIHPPATILTRVNLDDMIENVDHQPLARHCPDELAGLLAAMTRYDAACTADPRFISDNLTARDHAELSAVCHGCPIRQACDTFAAAARPEAGFWAGVQYPRPRTTPSAPTESEGETR